MDADNLVEAEAPPVAAGLAPTPILAIVEKADVPALVRLREPAQVAASNAVVAASAASSGSAVVLAGEHLALSDLPKREQYKLHTVHKLHQS